MSKCIKCASNGVTVAIRVCCECGHKWCPHCSTYLENLKCPKCGSNNTDNTHNCLEEYPDN